MLLSKWRSPYSESTLSLPGLIMTLCPPVSQLWTYWSNYIAEDMYSEALWFYSIVFHVLETNKYRNLASRNLGALFVRMTQCYASHEFHETCNSVTSYFIKKDYKRCCDTATPESIHTKDESKRGSAFAFIFGVN